MLFNYDGAPQEKSWTLQWKNWLALLRDRLVEWTADLTANTAEVLELLAVRGDELIEGGLDIEEDLSADDAAFEGDVNIAGDLQVTGDFVWENSPTLIGPIDTTSGTSISVPNIPPWARRITIIFEMVSTDNTSNLIIQLGTSSGLVVAGYVGSAIRAIDAGATTGAANTNGFRITNSWAAAAQMNGLVTLMLEDSANNKWVSTGVTARSDSSAWVSAGSVALTGPLTQLVLTTAGGVDVFDNGSMSARYEY